nr:ComEC/Rec2 family competence protein [uncultured Flavobacterium sp.]
MRYPIIPIAFFYVNGIFFSNQIIEVFSIELIWCFITFFFLILISFQFTFLKKRINPFLETLCFLFLFFFVGISSFQNVRTENKIPVNEFQYGVITINEVLKSNSYQNRYFANFVSTTNIEQKILLYQAKDSLKLKVGDQLAVTIFVETIPIAKNPYQFDYANYLKNKQIFIQAKLPENYLPLARSENLKFQLLYFRETLMNSFKIHHFTPEVNGVVNALLFGQRADLSEKIQTDYRNAGVMHILAISGMHIGILYWIINLILKSFIRPKNIRFITVIVILSCFAVITGLSGSVVRAVLMFTIVGSGLVFKRKSETTNVLALSMLLILIFNPYYIFDVGFQLSYMAVFSIVYLYPIIRPYFQSKYLVLNYFTELIKISIVAQLGILPLTVYYFAQIPLLFLLGNLIVIPILTVVLIGLVFVLILNFIWKDLSILIGKVLALLIDVVNEAMAFISSKDSFLLSNIKLDGITCVLLILIIFGIAYTIKKFSYNKLLAVFILIFVLQINNFVQLNEIKNKYEKFVLYDYQSLIFAISHKQNLFVYSDDSLILRKPILKDIIRENEINNIDFKYIENYIEINNLNYLIVDSLGISEISTNIDILILKNNPKFNLDRYLNKNNPKLIIAHPKNYKTNTVLWEQTCREKNIPFHNMREMGYVNLSEY